MGGGDNWNGKFIAIFRIRCPNGEEQVIDPVEPGAFVPIPDGVNTITREITTDTSDLVSCGGGGCLPEGTVFTAANTSVQTTTITRNNMLGFIVLRQFASLEFRCLGGTSEAVFLGIRIFFANGSTDGCWSIKTRRFNSVCISRLLLPWIIEHSLFYMLPGLPNV
jgi:hypothetical protein